MSVTRSIACTEDTYRIVEEINALTGCPQKSEIVRRAAQLLLLALKQGDGRLATLDEDGNIKDKLLILL
jgi:hypothetical protein